MQAIDERWEEVNVRATNTLENIEEDDMDEKDPGRRRRSLNPAVDKRREAGASLILKTLKNVAWYICVGDQEIGVGDRLRSCLLLLVKGWESPIAPYI